jgi:hypothetical protein
MENDAPAEEAPPAATDTDGPQTSGAEVAPGDEPAKAKPPRPKRVPRRSLSQAEQIAKKLFDAVGTGELAPASFMAVLGYKAEKASSAFDNAMALVRGYGLVERKKIRLTELGLRLLRNDDLAAQAHARRDAALVPGAFKEILTTLDGQTLPSIDTLTIRFRFDYGLSEEAAKQSAKAIASTAKYAGLIDESGTVHIAGGQSSIADEAEDLDDQADTDERDLGEQAFDRQGDSDGPEDEDEDDGDGDGDAEEAGPTRPTVAVGSLAAQEQNPAARPQTGERDEQSSRRSAKVPAPESGLPQLEMSVRLTGYTADEAIAILRTLGYPGDRQ